MKYFHDGKVALHAGDCLDVLKAMPENSIDAVVTDPPYGLKFMGREWDRSENIAFTVELWAEVLRVLKPGGHMVAFSGTRTYHRMTVAIEDAGFEIRDQLAWVYGSGFPKSHDVSKGIDRALGAERGKIRVDASEVRNRTATGAGRDGMEGATRPWIEAALANGYHEKDDDEPVTTTARQWQGWGTALKPAWEPICLARKPLSESTVAANVLRWGTGALNIDGCRINPGETISGGGNGKANHGGQFAGEYRGERPIVQPHASGRWPANLCHDGSAEVLAGFPETMSGTLNQSSVKADNRIYGQHNKYSDPKQYAADSGSVTRFFYTSKADADDRLNSKHPTVKPVDLMQWLVKLVCPKGATVLDPFAGTGTTGAASFIESRRCVLIEREAEYLADIERRMELLLSGPDERSRKLTKPDPHETLPLFA